MAHSVDGSVLGVIGGPDPAGALRAKGFEPSFADAFVAISGAVATTPPNTLVAGRIVSDHKVGSGTGDAARLAVGSSWEAGPPFLMSSPAMFGAALYRPDSGHLVLARDPLGERTMYYSAAQSDGSHWFSDRLTELRRIRAIGRDLSMEALRDYLIYAYVPGTQTMFVEGFEVAQGSTVTLRPRQPPQIKQVWKLREQLDHSLSFDEDADRLRTLLSSAVSSRRPDGPVGVYLSGGVDSSAITALLCEQDPTDVHTFAIHFGLDLPHELTFVNQVVERTKPHAHHEIELTAAELVSALPDTMAALDDPIGDPLTVPNLALGRRAAQIAPVIFNGEGGDPVFGGPKNQPMLLATLYGDGDSHDIGRSPAIDSLYLRSYQKCFNDLDRLLRPDVKAALAGRPAPEERIASVLSNGEMYHFVNRLFAANTRLKGSDHILTKVANLTAAAGVIGRSPLFDRAVVEAAFAMPPGHKLQGTIEKAVLKAAVADLLPATIIDRPKAGMRVPVQSWFRGPIKREGTKRLLSRRAHIAPYLERDVIKRWSKYEGDPSGKYGRKLWLLLSLERWMEAHDVG